MSDSDETVASFAGTGTSRLWLDPTADPDICESTLRAESIERTRFISVSIDWAYRGTPQHGRLWIGPSRGESAEIEAVWIDSWHMRDDMMRCRGHRTPDGTITLRGSYAAPPGPDWGWRIDLTLEPARAVLRMLNISPEGEESRAVEAEFVPHS